MLQTWHEDETHLWELAILNVFLSVQEPIRDFVLTRVGHDGDQFLNLEQDNKINMKVEALKPSESKLSAQNKLYLIEFQSFRW